MKWFGGEKEITEMDRVMGNIAQVEGELQQKIFQLGQLYYEKNKDRIDPQSGSETGHSGIHFLHCGYKRY